MPIKVTDEQFRAAWIDCGGEARKPFSVTVGTVYERSHIPLHKWLLATHLMTASKKGISAHQLHRMLGITYKSAWFMAHRIREAMDRIALGTTDRERADKALKAIEGKRLTYRRINERSEASSLG